MAPRPTYDTPQVQLLGLMVAARRRGEDFESCWWEAVREGQSLVMTNRPDPPPRCVHWPTDRSDRLAWQKAIYSTKDGWRRAYEGVEPTGPERAVRVLGDSIGALELVAIDRAAQELEEGLSPQRALPSAA